MPTLNTFHCIGNLTRDPELKEISATAKVCNFSIAVNHRWKTESGEKMERASFIDFKAWGKQGELIHQYVKKGDPIYVQGRMEQETWEKDGEKRSKLVCVVEQFQFLPNKRGKEGDIQEKDYEWQK